MELLMELKKNKEAAAAIIPLKWNDELLNWDVCVKTEII